MSQLSNAKFILDIVADIFSNIFAIDRREIVMLIANGIQEVILLHIFRICLLKIILNCPLEKDWQFIHA